MELTNTVLEQFSGQGWSTAVYTRPFGRQLVCEVTDTTYAKDAQVPYHVRKCGHETAILLAGRAQVTLYGKSLTLLPGDLVQIEPYMPNGIRFLEEGSVLRRVYHGADVAQLLRQRQSILDQCGDGAEALRELLAREGIRLLPEPAAQIVDDLPEVSRRGTGQEVFPRPGVCCSLRAGRWQLAAKAEIWELALEGGRTLTSPELPQEPSLLMVDQGSVLAEAGGERQTVQAGELLWFPPYEAYTLTAGEGGASLLDLWCVADLFRYLEELELAESLQQETDVPALAKACQEPLRGLV